MRKVQSQSIELDDVHHKKNRYQKEFQANKKQVEELMQMVISLNKANQHLIKDGT